MDKYLKSLKSHLESMLIEEEQLKCDVQYHSNVVKSKHQQLTLTEQSINLAKARIEEYNYEVSSNAATATSGEQS
jgi:hypothetical protein